MAAIQRKIYEKGTDFVADHESNCWSHNFTSADREWESNPATPSMPATPAKAPDGAVRL
ncbi:hypothetical protein RvY_17143 [Ramazzottius varieornatus]|uniref:Uncharacterized protein n=1 Tax=Ramazzottius varieornatus TaxID=947166 RepID=A0A1D1W200_RAMVA|nr:hypothetical protein RvY_17143 [Ramazzottius varieornatus]